MSIRVGGIKHVKYAHRVRTEHHVIRNSHLRQASFPLKQTRFADMAHTRLGARRMGDFAMAPGRALTPWYGTRAHVHLFKASERIYETVRHFCVRLGSDSVYSFR